MNIPNVSAKKFYEQRQAEVDRSNEALRNRKPKTPEELAALRQKIQEHKDQPREFVVERVDKPYLSDIFKGRWVVTVVESDGLIVRPADKLFSTEEEANAYYKDIAA